MPTRNRARLLQRAISSVLGQSLRDIELIVVNDASTDATAEVLDAIRDPRLRVLHRATNTSAGAARNAGIALARGEFVAFCDDDDYWLTQKLERQVTAFDEAGPDAGWCITGFIRLEPHGINRYVGGASHIRSLDYRNGIDPQGPTWSMIATPGWVVRRAVLDHTGGFDERIRSFDDWELGLRISRRCVRVVVDEPLWVQDWQNGGGLVKLERARGADLRIIMAKHPDLWSHDRRLLALHWYLVGRAESLYDPAPAGRDALHRSLRLAPWAWRTWAALVMSWLGQETTHALTRRIRQLRGA